MTQQHATPVLVVADDFTGANDAGCGLAKYGARVNVLFDCQTPLDVGLSDAWVINTDSRAVEAEQAASRVRQAIHHAEAVMETGWVFKKIDSTLRGNLGAETEAALLACGKSLAIIAPAVPALGRTTVQGRCFINGTLLTETEFATDPKTPVAIACIQQRLKAQTTLPCAHLTREALWDTPRLAQRVAALQAQGVRLLVVDAETEGDLQHLMQFAAELHEKPLLVGAAGLSDALSRWLYRQPRAPLLAVIGSMSDIAQQQIAFLRAHYPTEVIDVDVGELFMQPRWPQRGRWQEAIRYALEHGKHCVIRTVSRSDQRLEIDVLCQQHGYSRQQLGEAISQFLGELSRDALQHSVPSGLYLSGGDVAIAVARSLGAEGFTLKGQIAHCVPYGYLLNCYPTMLVMTKAGGFGDEQTLANVIRFLEGEVE